MIVSTKASPLEVHSDCYKRNLLQKQSSARNLINQSSRVACYNDLLHKKRIEVRYHPLTGLSACIHHLSKGIVINTQESLPIIGIPKKIAHEKNTQKLEQFFKITHLIPEKGVSGIYNRVFVHLSAMGGVKPSIPFQPGLALGSVIKGNTLDKMENYAKITAAMEFLEHQIQNAEQKIDLFQTKINSRLSQKNNNQDPLVPIWKKEILLLETFIGNIAKKIEEISKENKEIPVLERFQHGVISPIDFKSSKIEIQPRAFDTLKYSSEYISMREDNASVYDKASQLANANNFSVSAGWGGLFSAGVNYSQAEAIAKRVTDIKKTGKAEGVLVIHAIATTRHVRCFTDIQYNKDKLRQIMQAMKSGQEKELERYGITTLETGEKALTLLTEAVLGGSFSAIVTFLDESQLKRNMENKQKEESTTISAHVEGGYYMFKGKASFANANSETSRTEEDVLYSIAQTRVKIEFISEGSLPTFKRNVIEREITKHLNLNPAKYELSKKDEDEAKQLISGNGEEKQVALIKRNMKMENAQVAFLNTYKGLTSEKEKQNIHTMESVMDAYESFAQQMTTDNECGIPVGFYYQILTQKEIEKMLEEKNN